MALLNRRLSTCTTRTEKMEWLFAGRVTPLTELRHAARAGLSTRERAEWAKERQAEEIGRALDHAAILLAPGAVLVVAIERGELRLMSNGLPVFDRIFLSPEEGSFIALQWRLALRDQTFIGEAGAAALAKSLRKVRRTENAELRRQAETAGRHVLAYDLAIIRNQTELDAALDAAYELTAAEKAVIER